MKGARRREARRDAEILNLTAQRPNPMLVAG